MGSLVTLVLGMSPSSHVLSGTGPQETMTAPSTDINEDGKVNKSDLLLVVTALGETSPTNPRVDVDGDGRVAIADLLLVVENLDDPMVGAAPAIPALPISVDPQVLEAHLNVLRVSSDGSHNIGMRLLCLKTCWHQCVPRRRCYWRITQTRLTRRPGSPINSPKTVGYQYLFTI